MVGTKKQYLNEVLTVREIRDDLKFHKRQKELLTQSRQT